MTADGEVTAACPIPGAHRRLLEAHTLWHAAEEAYTDPELFRINLNALIQATRNVTFVLQNEHEGVPDFEAWYATWRERMGAEPVLRWSVLARNRVVKQGDLDTRSTARVSVIASYGGPTLVADITVPPMHSTEQIARELDASMPSREADTPLNKAMRENGLVRVERRWIDTDLPDAELLDALAHCYAVLADLVNDAHRLTGSDEATTDARPACMQATEEARTAYVHLGTHEVFHPRMSTATIDTSASEARYGENPQYAKGAGAAAGSGDVFAFAEAAVERAKTVLVKDGYHAPALFLFGPDGRVTPYALQFHDRQDKYVQWERVAREVERLGATGLVFISEAWIAMVDAKTPVVSPSEDPKRGEILVVTAAMADGRQRSYGVRFKRRLFGRFRFEPTVVLEDQRDFFLDAVRRVWKPQAPALKK